jgi:bifunctional UDP-N-acetylglucosamine pyrophosphorylase / glucosamine-1-phosphate N-acetyltransferase
MTSNSPKIAAIVLAAGEGTRLTKKPKNSNKVAMKLNGRPMIAYTLELLQQTGFDQIIAVVGFASDSVKKVLGDQVDYAFQKKRDGTGDAASCGLTALKKDIDYVLVLHGDDSAFYHPKILKKMIDTCQSQNLDMAFLTFDRDDPFAVGRIVRDEDGKPIEVVEEKNATAKQKNIKEVNLGMYCFKKSFIQKYIKDITFNQVTNEKYLTDIVAIAYKNNCPLEAVKIDTDKYWFGINTDEQLEEAKQKMAIKNKSN